MVEETEHDSHSIRYGGETHNLSQVAQANMATCNMTSHSALSAWISGLSSPLKPHNPILITGGNIQKNHNEGTVCK